MSKSPSKKQQKNNNFLSTDKILLVICFSYIYPVDHIFYLKQNFFILNLHYVVFYMFTKDSITLQKSDITAHLTCFQVLGIWPRYPSMHRFQVLPKDRNTDIETMTQCPFTKCVPVAQSFTFLRGKYYCTPQL